MAKYPWRAILVENSDYFQFDLPLNHLKKKKFKTGSPTSFGSVILW
jgi:hypothetical protein